MPRWSRLLTGAAAQMTSFAESNATLPGPSAIVSVGPPLFCKGPSTGSLLIPGQAVSGQLRLPPPSVMMPEQFPPVGLLATIVFSSVTVYPELRIPPPSLALLLAKVLLITVSPPKLEIPPPAEALLPKKVLLLTVNVP